MLKITSNNTLDLNRLAANHYEYLNPKYKTSTKKGQYKQNSLISKIKSQSFSNDVEEEFLKFLLGENEDRLKKILIGSPSDIHEVVIEYTNTFPSTLLTSLNDKGKLELTDFGKKIKGIFNYKTYRSSEICKNFLLELGFRISKPCPYCNLDSLSVVFLKKGDHNNEELISRALLDLDHFYPQSLYPFLALSLFNLIPSCHNCNSSFKGDKPFNITTHINPFDKSFEDNFKFSLEEPFITGQDFSKIKIKYSNKLGFPENTFSDFQLISRYEAHLDLLAKHLNIIAKNRLSRINEIDNLFANTSSEEEVFTLACIPTTEGDIVNYPLGKLKCDICLDIGILT